MGTLPVKIGRYKVERLLGEGGMGVLYLARDPVIDRHVALKLLRVNGEDLRRRFMREAQSAGRLQHPNIVTVYDVGDHDGQLFIAMEYIDGDTLATLIRDDVPFSAIRKLDIIDEVADGLGYAHQRGIVHRDIKPANLMITRAGLVKVLDFGIARVSHRESREFDAPTLIGTPAYMAPEQLEGAEVDARSDIYAVGLVMYELFSGCRAFGGSTTADVLQKVLAAQPTPITQLVPGIDKDLAGVIARSMARQPGERYQDLQAMRKDLARARRRAMQASSDDVTMVVTLPVTRPVAGAAKPAAQAGVQTPPPAPAIRAVHPPSAAAPPPPAAPVPAVQTEEDIALAHLAATSQARRDTPSLVPSMDETVIAPLKAVAMPPAPTRAPASAVPPAAAPPMTPPPPPLPSTRGNDGPLPVALPPMAPNAGAPVSSAGRTTADSSAIHAARERAAAPPRPAVAAPPPVAANTAPAPAPAARAGLPVAVIVVAILGVLAMCLLVAMLVGRALGLVSMSGLFARTVEPTVSAVVAEEARTTDAPVVDTTPARQEESPGDPPRDTPAGGETEVARARETETARQTSVVPPRESRTAEERIQPPVTTVARTAPPRDIVRDTPVAISDTPSRPPVEYREPELPPAQAEPPQTEGVALVRAYVAARNTAHASGIRRVWPAVDDGHLRRVTSSFSAPLTLSTCRVTLIDGSHATASCQLAQAGTTGAYAPDQNLSIRRTFVFDLGRQGRGWVITGVRE